MTQIFPPNANTIARSSLLGLVLLAGLGAWGWAALLRSDYATGANIPVRQPVQFSHEHHVSGLGIDCRYCHTSVERSSFAGIPPLQTCMTCHSQIWADSPFLAPVRNSFQTGQPIRWVRVYNLPDFVYFNHSIHVNKGIGCSECHGRVDRMPQLKVAQPLWMRWCLDCHRNPEQFVRPRSEVFNMKWVRPVDQLDLGRRLVGEYNIQRKTDCITCHR